MGTGTKAKTKRNDSLVAMRNLHNLSFVKLGKVFKISATTAREIYLKNNKKNENDISRKRKIKVNAKKSLREM